MEWHPILGPLVLCWPVQQSLGSPTVVAGRRWPLLDQGSREHRILCWYQVWTGGPRTLQRTSCLEVADQKISCYEYSIYLHHKPAVDQNIYLWLLSVKMVISRIRFGIGVMMPWRRRASTRLPIPDTFLPSVLNRID